ncbi:hypothetical protein EIP91_002838 [Steccherinum ochraceum]|uniref:NAD(P)-binding protein n=1 Tax=Steccherinum ochraceum TaxID=92696 RepID=A0A4R0RDV6_9APHY|nr:hypothetical protein EIP91_002838 [Steccherinum ochraceum]
MADIADYTPGTAIVTGAAQGIGKSIALRLADDGFNVVVSDLETQKDKLDAVAAEIRTKGRRAVVVPTNVLHEEEVAKLVEKTVEELGGLDVMVANAGVARNSSFLELTTDDYDFVMNVNARGLMMCYKHAAKQMVKQKRGGRILGASSGLGKSGRAQYLASYSASKFAVRGLTQALAFELKEQKITVNTYAPGIIITDMTDNPTYDVTIGEGKPGSFLKHLCNLTPDAPDAGPEVVASIVSYICKPEAFFITGQSISVDGGLIMS